MLSRKARGKEGLPAQLRGSRGWILEAIFGCAACFQWCVSLNPFVVRVMFPNASTKVVLFGVINCRTSSLFIACLGLVETYGREPLLGMKIILGDGRDELLMCKFLANIPALQSY